METCAVPLAVFHLVSGIHALVCAITGLIGAHYKRSQDREEMMASRMDRDRLTESLMLHDKMEVELRETTANGGGSMAGSLKFDESVDSSNFMKRKGKGGKGSKGGKGGKKDPSDPTTDTLSLIGESGVKIMGMPRPLECSLTALLADTRNLDWLFRFSWLVAGSTWVYSTTSAVCSSELFWGTYVFISVGWVNFFVTLVATITSLVYAFNGS